jgi:hypothetical protein
VPYARIKKTLDDFERVDLRALIEQCKNEIEQRNISNSLVKKNTGQFIPNFSDYLSKTDWSLPEFSEQAPSIPIASPRPTVPSPLTAHKASNSNLPTRINDSNKENNSQVKFELNPASEDKLNLNEKSKDEQENNLESLELLKQMFPNIGDNLIKDLIEKYHCDVSLVTNILLDSSAVLDIASYKSNEEKQKVISIDNLAEHRRESDALKNKNEIQEKVPSLKYLCQRLLDHMNVKYIAAEMSHARKLKYSISVESNESSNLGTKFEKLNKPVQKAKSFSFKNSNSANHNNNNNNNNKSGNIKLKKATKADDIKPKINDKQRNNINKDDKIKLNASFSNASNVLSEKSNQNRIEEDDYNDEDEPVLKLKLPKHFLSSLVQLYGEEKDENLINEGYICLNKVEF